MPINNSRIQLASYTYDSAGTPVSVAVGPDPTNSTTTPRYWYVYNGHGDVVNLVDASGNVVASYAYDTWGNPTSVSEAIPNANGWSNPYRYDGRDGVRYDASDGLYWMRVRAYDPTIGRFISHDPLGRAPLFFADNPYVYAGNNPVSNVDPSGQRYTLSNGGGDPQPKQHAPKKTRVKPRSGNPKHGNNRSLPASVLRLFGACGGCNSIWRELAANINGVRLMGVILVFAGFIADLYAISMIMKSAAQSPDLAESLRLAVDVLGNMERVMDFVSMMSNVVTIQAELRGGCSIQA